jgi:predicted nucleotidyltransferase
VDHLIVNHDDRIIETLRSALPELLAVYRFGSHGSLSERSDSDIDLAVLALQPLDPLRVWDLGQELAVKLKREVDLVDLARASTVLAAQVVTAGTRLYCADRNRCSLHEDYILSSYARLNEERKDILTDTLRRGSVYGG